MASNSLNKSFPHVDNVCDAPFLKKVTGITNKKDTVTFILTNPDCRQFFSRLDSEMVESDSKIQEKISKYFTTIPDALSQYKQSLKVVHEQVKLSKKQAERDVLKAEIQREMEAEKVKKAQVALIRSELDLPAEPAVSAETTGTIKTPKPNIISTTPNLISNELHSIPAPELTTSPIDISNQTSPSELGLDDIFRYFKATLDGGYFKILSSNGQPITIKTVEFDHQQITVIIETATPNPTLSIAKTIAIPKVVIR